MQLVQAISARLLSLSARLARLASSPTGLLRNERGAIPVEYIAVFAFVTVGMTVALVKLGPNLFAAWGQTQKVLLASKP